MPAFTCRSRDLAGLLVENTIEAGSQREAILRLEEEGLIPIEVNAQAAAAQAEKRVARTAPRPASSPAASRRLRRGKVKRKQLMRFSIQLASSIDAGVPLLSALEFIRRQTQVRAMELALGGLIADIKAGLSLSGAMRNQPHVFPESYACTIAAGEEAGSLDGVLDRLGEHLEAETELISNVRSALMYPAIVVVTLFAAISILVVFVMPNFAAFYAGFKAELPLPTRILIAISEAVSQHALVVVPALAAVAWGSYRFVRTPRGRRFVEPLVSRIPVIGTVVETAVTLQAVQMIGLFTHAGVAMLQGLQTIAATTTSWRMQQKLIAVSEQIAAGGTLSDSLETAQCFPLTARQMLANGEVSGSLEHACSVVARHYARELRYLTKNLSTLIEPLLTLLLAGIVLFVALAAFLPMWDIVTIVR